MNKKSFFYVLLFSLGWMVGFFINTHIYSKSKVVFIFLYGILFGISLCLLIVTNKEGEKMKEND